MATTTTPHTIAPRTGYYGPEWFTGGVFIGVGPWFHGPRDFHGHVDNRFDPHHGYVGPHPERGDKPFDHFHGNEMRDGRTRARSTRTERSCMARCRSSHKGTQVRGRC